MIDSYMNIIAPLTMLRDFRSDIKYVIENEDAKLNVSINDLHRIDSVVTTIRTLEAKYENLHDKIALTIGKRMKEIGRENAETDELCQVLHAILESERKVNDE